MERARPTFLKSLGLSVQGYEEETANSIIHLVGFGLSIVGLCILVSSSIERGTNWHIFGSAVFGSSLINLYLVSTLYHGIRWRPAKGLLQYLDHVSIYLLIAGSYTPLALTFLRPTSGWLILGTIWGMAIAGTVWKTIYGARYKVVSTLAYIVMGWTIVIAYKPMLNDFPFDGLMWLLAGAFFTRLVQPSIY